MGWFFDWLAANKDAAPLAASLSAILAVGISPLLQRWVGLRQQRAVVVSNNRVRWIEEFRKDIAEFCELCHAIIFLREQIKKASDKNELELANKLVDKLVEQIIKLTYCTTH